jgi:hypothetical protein
VPSESERAQREEWEQHVRDSLAKWRCPDSGELMRAWLPEDGWNYDFPDGRVGCEQCDCFGYDPDQVGPRG